MVGDNQKISPSDLIHCNNTRLKQSPLSGLSEMLASALRDSAEVRCLAQNQSVRSSNQGFMKKTSGGYLGIPPVFWDKPCEQIVEA